MNFAKKAFRSVFLLFSFLSIFGTAVLEVFFSFLIADDQNQGITPWEDFWDLTFHTVIRFLVVLLFLFIMYKVRARKLLTYVFISAIVLSVMFLSTRSFLFLPPFASNLVIAIMSGLLVKKLKSY